LESGDTYEGQWLANTNVIDGHGKYINKIDKSVYEGNLKNGKF